MNTARIFPSFRATGLSAAIVGMAVLASAAGAQNIPIPIPAPRGEISRSQTIIPVAFPIQAPRTAPARSAPAPAAEADPLGALLDRVTGNPVAEADTKPVVIGLRLGEDAERSRFVVELSDPVDVHVFTLTEPNRVVIDMPEVLWRAADAVRPNGRGPVESYRYGLFREGNSRFVIDLNSPVRVGEPQLLPPSDGFGFRLVVDLYPETIADFIARAGWPEELAALETPSPAAIAPPRPGAPTKRIIVVDAGHGGIDPGTHGPSGLLEKTVVLSVAQKLRDALEATGRYTVHLTRDTDVFIPLRGRVDIARAAKADLFLSLHIDSHESHDIRGASVYTLSEDASDREAASLAEKENMSDIIAGVDLSGDNNPVATILIDLAQRDTLNRSVRFAETVLTTLREATAIRPSTPHRAAGFAVLKAPDVPAALIELGYITNHADEAEMTTEAWRSRVAVAITAAVHRHFGTGTSPAAVQASIP